MTLPFDQTLGLSHPFSVGKNVHSILGNPNSAGTFYADIAARDADTAFQVPENIGKAVGITSPLSIFVLMSTGPAVWLELSSTLTDSFLELIDTPSSYSGEALKVVSVNAGETGLEFTVNAAGDVFGPASSVDNAVARFDLATGKLIQDSKAILDDDGVLFLNTDQIEGLGLRVNASSGSGQIELDGPTGSSIFFQRASVPEWETTVLLNVPSTEVDFLISDISVGGGPAVIFRGGTRDTNIINNLIVGADNESPDSLVHLIDGTAGGVAALAGTVLTIERLGDAFLSILTPNVNDKGILFGDVADNDAGFLKYLTNDDMVFGTAGANRFRINATDIDAITKKIVNVVDPTADQDAATKKYVDDQILTQDTFLELTDTPSSYSGEALKGIRVNAGETALEFVTDVGDVDGPASSLDNSVPTFDLATGKLIQDPGALFLTNISNDVEALLKSGATTAESILAFEDSATRRMEVGNKSSTVFETTLGCSQIIMNNSDTALRIATRANIASDLIFYTAPSVAGLLERVRFKGDGKVGIGTGAPDSTLHVFDGTAGTFTPLAGTAALLENDNDAYLTLAVPDSATHGILFGNPTSNVHGGIFYTVGAGLQFRTNLNITRMNIRPNGFVAIGDSVTTPDTRLHVVAGFAGVVAAAGGSTLCLESNTSNFIHFKQPNANGAGLLIGDPDLNVAGALTYSATDEWSFSTTNNTVRALLNDSTFIVGVTSAPQGIIHANRATSGATASNFCQEFIAEHIFDAGLSIISGNTGRNRVCFGDVGNSQAGLIIYDHNDDSMVIRGQGNLSLDFDQTTFADSLAFSRTPINDGNYTVVATDYLLAISAITAARTITFSSAEIAKAGKEWPIKDESGDVDGVNTITLATEGAQTIDGQTSLTFNVPYFDLIIYTNGTNLFVRGA